MRSLLTFIGGIAVGILTVTGVYAMEEDEKPSSIDCDNEQELEEEQDDEGDENDAVIFR